MQRLLPVLVALVVAIGTTHRVPGQRAFPLPDQDPEAGFESIFDGATLDGWEGDSTYWRVEDGALVGEVTQETLLSRNSFIIWRQGTTRDFELKAEYRISADGNSGINYRSVEVPDLPWALQGYQADIDGRGRWTGQLYEERGRTFLAMRGQLTEVPENMVPTIRARIGGSEELWSVVRPEDWNSYHIVARGNVLIHIINGQVMSQVIDADASGFSAEGLLGVQVHVGPPMKVEFRNIRIKHV